MTWVWIILILCTATTIIETARAWSRREPRQIIHRCDCTTERKVPPA